MLRIAALVFALSPLAAFADSLPTPFDPSVPFEIVVAKPADIAVAEGKPLASAPPARLVSGKAFRLAFIHEPAEAASAPASPLEHPLAFILWGASASGVDGD